MEGEKELVLGNKQLVSFFFVVLALCGVFFALGYIIRGNSVKQPAATADASAAQDQTPLPAVQTQQMQQPEPSRETAESAPPASDKAAPPVPDKAPSPAPVAMETQPVHEPPVPLKAAPMETNVTYLQVAALRRTDAENLVKTLREQSFPGLLEQSSKPDLFRVLVGPYHQTAEVADAKVKLKALGFSDAKVEKK